MDLNFGQDFKHPQTRQMIIGMVKKFRPWKLIMGISCVLWNLFNENLNYPSPERQALLQRLREEEYVLVEFAAQLAWLQMEEGRLFLIENPVKSRLWSLPCIEALMSHYGVWTSTTDAGAWGAEIDDKPVIKGLRFIGNQPGLDHVLNKRLTPAQREYCTTIQGKMTKASQVYPDHLVCAVLTELRAWVHQFEPYRFALPQMVYAVVPAQPVADLTLWQPVVEEVERRWQNTTRRPFYIEPTEPLGHQIHQLTRMDLCRIQAVSKPTMRRLLMDANYDYSHRAAFLEYNDSSRSFECEDLASIQFPKQKFAKPVRLAIFCYGTVPNVDAPKQPDDDEDNPRLPLPELPTDITFPGLPAGIPPESRRLVARLHCNLGHPNSTEMARMIAYYGGAPASVMTCIQCLHCATCERLRPPQKARPSTMPQLAMAVGQFGDQVQMDIFFTKTVDARTIPILGMIDRATGFHQGGLLPSRDSSEVFDLIHQIWLRPYGLPYRILADEDRVFEKNLEDHTGPAPPEDQPDPIMAPDTPGTIAAEPVQDFVMPLGPAPSTPAPPPSLPVERHPSVRLEMAQARTQIESPTYQQFNQNTVVNQYRFGDLPQPRTPSQRGRSRSRGVETKQSKQLKPPTGDQTSSLPVVMDQQTGTPAALPPVPNQDQPSDSKAPETNLAKQPDTQAQLDSQDDAPAVQPEPPDTGVFQETPAPEHSMAAEQLDAPQTEHLSDHFNRKRLLRSRAVYRDKNRNVGSQPDDERSLPLYLLPPDDGLIRKTNCWKAKAYQVTGNIYGLPNAPRLWAQEVVGRLEKCGYERHSFDKMLFMKFTKPDLEGNRQILSLILVYVDDFLGTYRQDYDPSEVYQAFKWGSINTIQENVAVTFKGKELTLLRNAKGRFTLKVTMKSFIDEIEQRSLARGRMQADLTLSPEERTEFRSISGCLQWASTQARPDVSAVVSLTNGSNIDASHLKTLYETAAYLKSTATDGLLFQDIAMNAGTVLLTYTDASWANAAKGGSQLGILVTDLGGRPSFLEGLITALRPWTFPAILGPQLVLLAVLKSVLRHPLPGYTVVFALLVALIAIQAAANLVNSYMDFKKGIDKSETAGDRTLVDGLVSFTTLKVLGLLCLGFWLCFFGWSVVATNYSSTVLGWATLGTCLALGYTAGPAPLKYLGLGDLTVLICFGPGVLAYSSEILVGSVPSAGLVLTLPAALYVVAILHANNYRDIEADR
ncbi:UbiA prenyltransferase domain-containing protein 1, partial [Durusdinium trenchii]